MTERTTKGDCKACAAKNIPLFRSCLCVKCSQKYGALVEGQMQRLLNLFIMRSLAEKLRNTLPSNGSVIGYKPSRITGRPPIATQKVEEMMKLFSMGVSVREISRRLNIANGTVSRYFYRIGNDYKCGCGKPLLHRQLCKHKLNIKSQGVSVNV